MIGIRLHTSVYDIKISMFQACLCSSRLSEWLFLVVLSVPIDTAKISKLALVKYCLQRKSGLAFGIGVAAIWNDYHRISQCPRSNAFAKEFNNNTCRSCRQNGCQFHKHTHTHTHENTHTSFRLYALSQLLYVYMRLAMTEKNMIAIIHRA